MPAFVNLPWLTSSDQFLKAMLSGGEAGIQRERNQQQASEAAGQLGLGYSRLGVEQQNTIARLAQAQAEQEAQDRYHQELLKDADARINLSQARMDALHNPFQVMALGNGEVARINKMTGEMQTLQGAREKPAKEPTVSVPILPEGMDPMMVGALGIPTQRITGPVSRMGQYMTHSTSGTGTTKQPQGGYKVGTVYNGLKYLGGDPNDESNWEKRK